MQAATSTDVLDEPIPLPALVAVGVAGARCVYLVLQIVRDVFRYARKEKNTS